MDGRMDRRTDGQTDGWMDGPSDRRTERKMVIGMYGRRDSMADKQNDKYSIFLKKKEIEITLN